MKIFILMGNGDKDTMCGRLSLSYKKGAEDAGHEVRLTNIGDMKFDPILHQGYKTIQELEPDLKKVQEDITWCEHFVLIYPTWWSAMPALLKGMFDRMWLPGFAFKFNEKGIGWHGLLHGKSARVMITMDSWPLVSRLLFGDATNEIGRAILHFSGLSPVKILKVGPLEDITEPRIQKWLTKAYKLGKKAR